MTTTEQHATQRAWDAIAAGYDRATTPTHMWLGNEGLRRAGLRPGMRLLDVAAGSGALSIPAARLGARVLATDLSPAMLDQLARSPVNPVRVEDSWSTLPSLPPVDISALRFHVRGNRATRSSFSLNTRRV